MTLTKQPEAAASDRRAEMESNTREDLSVRLNEEQFRTLADSIPQLAWMANADGSIFWYNQRWYDYTGTTLEDMEGWGWQSVHDPEFLPRVMEEWQASILTGNTFDMKFPLRGREGSFRWFLTRVTPLRDGEGRVVRWVGTNTDIEEQRRVEEALVRANAEMEARVAERTAELSRAVRLLEEQVAERRRAEEELQKEREFLGLLDNLAEGIVACDAAGVLTLFTARRASFTDSPKSNFPPSGGPSTTISTCPTGRRGWRRGRPALRALEGHHVRDAEMVIAPKEGARARSRQRSADHRPGRKEAGRGGRDARHHGAQARRRRARPVRSRPRDARADA